MAGNEAVIREMREMVDHASAGWSTRPIRFDQISSWADRLEVSGCGGGEPSQRAWDAALEAFGVDRLSRAAGPLGYEPLEKALVAAYAIDGLPSPPGPVRPTDEQGRPLCFTCNRPQSEHPGGVECSPGPEALSPQEAEAMVDRADGFHPGNLDREHYESALSKLRAIAAGEGER